MRKNQVLTLLAVIAIAIPLGATTTTSPGGRHQSYISYDDGGTVVKQAEDGREIDARLNLPIFEGDELVTGRRSRTEVRLADGNVIGIDRTTDIIFKSMAENYDADSLQTVVELRFGHIVFHRADNAQQNVRLDTQNASYAATEETVYAVDSDGRGKDRVTVFDGVVEVRTPAKTTRLRAGEEVHVDEQGVYGLVSEARTSADDFETWFLKRADRYGRGSSKYLDRSIAYSDYDLDQAGSWIYVSGLRGWAWRPYGRSASWRPYYYGNWVYGPSGCLVWVSDEPWGWVPYHYGRWAYDPGYGWVWLPGAGYAPAWVYWMYGPSYIGWAPSGWWDCYRPYYDWCYRPYARASFEIGFGFFGRVRFNELDLRPWTFLDSGTIFTNRADRAALTADAVRNRLMRDGGSGGTVTIGASPARFSRPELRDPATAVTTIARRGIGSGTGKDGPGSPTDLTPFFRRDPELSTAVRDRVARTHTVEGSRGAALGGGSIAPIGSGSVAPIGSGSIAPIGGGSVAPIGGRLGRGDTPSGTTTPADGGRGTAGDLGRIHRGDNPAASSPDPNTSLGNWRDRIGRATRPSYDTPVERTPGTPASGDVPRDDAWRGRAVSRGETPAGTPAATPAPPRSGHVPAQQTPASRGSDVPRRIIDRIGGARISPGDGGGSRSSGGRSHSSGSGSSSGSSGSSGSGSSGGDGGGRASTPPPSQPSSPPPSNSAPPPAPPPSNNNGEGHVHRDHQG